MCGACPGGTLVSPTTAELNRTGRKRLVLAELRHRLAPGCTLTLVGDGWTLRRRTGRQEVFADIEPLLTALRTHAAADWTVPEEPRAVVAQILASPHHPAG
ncbi:hypothetical protein [Microbacterium sp. A93]|uniref:hypothetical protein n=1 Tax=Microbacterium sp. A93 TaxID=3450716 RepID=UPI003F41C33E